MSAKTEKAKRALQNEKSSRLQTAAYQFLPTALMKIADEAEKLVTDGLLSRSTDGDLEQYTMSNTAVIPNTKGGLEYEINFEFAISVREHETNIPVNRS